MKRWVPWQDWLMFLGLPTVATALGLGALLTPQEWDLPKALVLVFVIVMFWVIAVAFLWKRRNARPDFQLTLGTAVWTNGLPITVEDIGHAINFYIRNAAHAHRRLDESTLFNLFAQTQIEFTEKALRWGEKKYAGLQRGKAIKVQWRGGFDRNAFFHECHHLVDENLFGLKDYKHERVPWWSLIDGMKIEWRQKGPKSESATT